MSTRRSGTDPVFSTVKKPAATLAPEGVARGSVLTLDFDDNIPGLTVDEVKKMLLPVFDFTEAILVSSRTQLAVPVPVR